jgi:hypothetical protein
MGIVDMPHAHVFGEERRTINRSVPLKGQNNIHTFFQNSNSSTGQSRIVLQCNHFKKTEVHSKEFYDRDSVTRLLPLVEAS